MKIQKLIDELSLGLHRGDAGQTLSGVVDDSRQVSPGCLFVARPGKVSDGRRFIDDAVSRGAAAVLTDQPIEVDGDVAVLLSDDVARAGLACANVFHQHPAKQLKLIGITGTNGKTTTAFMIRHLLNAARQKCGLIGTIELDTGAPTGPRPAELTTPGAVQMISLLAEMVANGCQAAVMEVSSHALDQGRVAGLDFDAAVFTNLTGDHLDYHGTMDAYAAAKAKLFDSLRTCAKAIVNADDPAAKRMLRDTTARRFTFGIDDQADCRITLRRATARSIECTYTGPWGAIDVTVPLPGKHNAANLAGGLLAMHALGFDISELTEAIADCPPVPGRLEPVTVDGVSDFDVLVDYAHTDDALANVLTALRAVTRHRLRVAFGCGGDRDRTKRPRMAKVACELADDVVITSDNPRTEDPSIILDDIVAGVPVSMRSNLVVEPDRAAAIRLIINAAEPGDVVLIAGKGHEDYQIIGTVKHHFDDREQAAAALADRVARVV